ncbi:MAG: hypothetical protein ACE5HJ_02735 [Thermoplasmata archaeon]
MKRSTSYALLSIFLLAVYLRLLPVTRYLFWGADFGEYFLITRLLSEGSPLPDPYLGWGVGYPEFSGMEVLVASTSWTGIPLEAAAVLMVPILSSLIVVPAFLIGREVTGRDWPALLAAAIVAVVLPHVYPTSHPIPGALGDLFVASSLLLLLRLREDGKLFALLIPLALALVVVHHLSSYILMISTFMVAFMRVALRGASFGEIRRETALLGFLVGANVAYWAVYAESFRTFLGIERFPWWVTAILILALPAVLYPISILRSHISWTYRPSSRPASRDWKILGLAALLTSLILVVFYYSQVPGTTVSVSQASLLYSAPFVFLFLFSAPGRRYFDFLPGGPSITSWFLALNISWILGGFIAPTFLIPYRHLEYLTLPLAIFGGMGAFQLMRAIGRGKRLLVLLLSALIILGALTALPPREVLGNHFEGTRAEGMNVVQWSVGRVDGVTATDHRASSILFGFTGVRATWDSVSLALHAPSFDEARQEMEWVEELPGGPGRVDYVLLDRDLVAGAMLFPWDPALPLSPQALDKFLGGDYLKLYDDGYSQLYRVNWGAS